MKRGTPRHPKTYALAEILKIRLPEAVGILEMLWHHAAQHTPMGDIGSLPNSAIAAAVDWGSDKNVTRHLQKCDQLVTGLVKSGWLDVNDRVRLMLHDWPDHCDQSVVKSLEYNHKDFLLEYGVSLEKRKRFSRDSLATREGIGIGLGFSYKKEEKEKEESKKKELKENQEGWFSEELWPLCWRKVDRAEALKSFCKIAATEELKSQIVAAARRASEVYLKRDADKRPHLSTWLNKKRFNDELAEDPRGGEEEYDVIKNLRKAVGG